MGKQEINATRTKTPEQALESLRRSCSKMERTASDVRRSLYRWGVDRAQWDGIVEVLQRERFIDHVRYAGCYVRDKISNSTWGERKIRSALAAKGIEREVIDQAWQQYGTAATDDRLMRQIARKAEQLMAKPYAHVYELRRKLFAWGASRGYDFDQINSAIEEVFTDIKEQDEF